MHITIIPIVDPEVLSSRLEVVDSIVEEPECCDVDDMA